MEDRRDTNSSHHQEVNLKLFFKKVYKHKILVLLSIFSFLALAILYIFVADRKYEASTSVIIDSSGRNRVLGESKYVDGGVSLIEMEKNLYNEIGIIKSFSLIRQTVEDLNFDVSYHAGNMLRNREHYGYFPFEVMLTKPHAQLYDIPFEVEILSGEKYRLHIEGNDFLVSIPVNNSTYEVTEDFVFSKEISFGEMVNHDYFSFTIKKPDYEIRPSDFDGVKLSFKIHEIDAVANGYVSSVKVDNIDIQASIFKIASTGPAVEKEIAFLKKLTENYVQNELDSRKEIAEGKESFIRNQLRVISDSLSRVELELELFKKDKRALNLGATARNALGQSSNLQVEKARIEQNIEYYNSLIKNVQDNRNSEDFIIPTAVGIEDPLINENIIELKKLYSERSKKKFYVTSTNQEMTILNNQIKESTNLLLNNLRNAIKSSEFALQRATSQLSNYSGVISTLPMRENQLLALERQSTLYGNLFNYLSQELAKAGIARAERTSFTRVLDEARMVGDGPVAPQKMMLLVLALILGTIIPLAWIVLFSPDDIIENVGQITESTNIPVIASIVQHDSKSKKSQSDISLWKVKESFRDLGANLKFLESKEPCVIGITSIMPNEGKTYNAINLGITLAEAGKKTLIIDADLRNPSLVKGIYKVQGKGLSDYLDGDIRNLNQIVHPHERLDKLKFIPTSVVKGNVHELLSGTKMELLLLKLKEEYDYIIIDTPAIGLVSDYLLLTNVIDVNLFVVRRKIAKIGFLHDIEQFVSGNMYMKSFIIYNSALTKEHKYGYKEKYGLNDEMQLVNDHLSV